MISLVHMIVNCLVWLIHSALISLVDTIVTCFQLASDGNFYLLLENTSSI